MQVWIDGVARPELATSTAAKAPPLPPGDGLFESVKVVDGRTFALELHLERLAGAARDLGLPAPDLDAVRRVVAVVVAERPLALGRVRLAWTGGGTGGAASGGEPPEPVLTVVADPVAPAASTVDVVTAPWRREARGPLAGAKATAYADHVLALADARRRGAGEALWVDTAGRLVEGTGSNVLYVLDGELRTPSLATGCLPGVTRRLVLEWCGAREVDEPAEWVRAEASEVFLVSTTRDVQPVRRWDGRELPAPGPVTREVRSVWRRREGELLGRPTP